MTSNRKRNRDFSVKDLVLTALMTAIVFLATFVPHIPIPLGYAHLGDAAICAAAFGALCCVLRLGAR